LRAQKKKNSDQLSALSKKFLDQWLTAESWPFNDIVGARGAVPKMIERWKYERSDG
jgi:hypothetical protein